MKNIVEFWVEHAAVLNEFSPNDGVSADDAEVYLSECMVEELLSLTMLEVQYKCRASFKQSSLFALFSAFDPSVVESVFKSELIQAFVHTDKDGEIRIKDDYNARRSAMSYCGVFYAGYGFDVPPPNEGDICIIDFLYEIYNKKGQVKLSKAEADRGTIEFFENLAEISFAEAEFEIEERFHNAVPGNAVFH